MKLDIKKRVQIAGLLPAEGDFTTLKTISKLREALWLSEDEKKKWKVTQEADQIRWDPAVDTTTEIKVGDLARILIAGQLKKLDEQKKLTLDLMDIYERFVEAKDESP